MEHPIPCVAKTGTMSDPKSKAANTSALAVTPEGTPLSDIYGRLVPLHASIDEGNPISSEFQNDVARELMTVLRLIEANPEFRAAHEADVERRRLHPTSEELAALERGRATVERFRRAREEHRREEQRARERADVSGG